MRAWQVIDVKAFMAKLLMQDVFDQYLVSEMMINTFSKFEINGKLNADFYSTQELEELHGRTNAKWSELRPIAFSLVKGKKIPLSFHINLMLSKEQIEKVVQENGVSISAEDISGLYIHIKFENGILYVITGTGIKIFTMDKTLDNVWDDIIRNYLKKLEVAVKEE